MSTTEFCPTDVRIFKKVSARALTLVPIMVTPQTNNVVLVLTAGSPTKVVKMIILAISVPMAALHPLLAGGHKGFQYETVNSANF